MHSRIGPNNQFNALQELGRDVPLLRKHVPTKRGIPKCNYATAKGQKIVTEVFNALAMMKAFHYGLAKIAREHFVCGFHSPIQQMAARFVMGTRQPHQPSERTNCTKQSNTAQRIVSSPSGHERLCQMLPIKVRLPAIFPPPSLLCLEWRELQSWSSLIGINGNEGNAGWSRPFRRIREWFPNSPVGNEASAVGCQRGDCLSEPIGPEDEDPEKLGT
jgi:hypothetical protein